MIRTRLLPLRTTVGQPLPLFPQAVTVRGPLAGEVTVAGQQSFAAIDLPYDGMLPGTLTLSTGSQPYPPADEIRSYPMPPDLPFQASSMPFLTVHWLGPQVDKDISRTLWFELDIDLAQSMALYNQMLGGKVPARGLPAIGGLCFGGYPYLPYYVTPEGQNSANFGLPREIRVSWQATPDDDFLDAETALTRQEMASHSGVHLLATGPVGTGRLKIRFADMPRLILRLAHRGKLLERWGCIIPFLYVYAYQEGTRYRPHVPLGLVAATHRPAKIERSYASTLDPAASPDTSDAVAGIAPDLLLTTGVPLRYHPMTAASLVGTPRSYAAVPGATEMFMSQRMEAGDRLHLVVEQTEEHARCLAGLVLDYPKEAGQDVCDLEVRVFALDPMGGVSPVDPDRPADDDRYAQLLVLQRIRSWDQRPAVLRFTRPTLARWLAVAITWLGPAKGHVILTRLHARQSAHVAVAARRGHTQKVRALGFRIIGDRLADDYAALGDQPFSLVVEHAVGGDAKAVLFEANSLVDLVRQPGVRLFANQRYLETVRDVSQESAGILDTSYERRRSESGSYGWRRSETGKEANWVVPAGAQLDGATDVSNGDFRVEQASETRSHNAHLGGPSVADQVRSTIEDLGEIIMGADWELPDAVDTFLTVGAASTALSSGWDDLWTCLLQDSQQIADLLEIKGLRNFSAPAYSYPATFVEAVAGVLANPLGTGEDDLAAMITSNPVLGPMYAIQGLSVGTNLGASFNKGVGVGIPPITFSGGGALSSGVSISASPQLPTLVHTSTTGSAGTITLQTSRQACAYTQMLD
ncbi:MAG: hypothetical protein KDA49_13445, partial [Rhodospirillaceae bacterium]|nr:hypothetical protein [Rhodospirillaceae bacterium]